MIEYSGRFTPSKNKLKRLFNVYKVEDHIYNGMGQDAHIREFVGQTMSVSAKKAAANVAFRMGAPVSETVPWWGDGCRITKYVAEVAEDDYSGRYPTTGGETQKP